MKPEEMEALAKWHEGCADLDTVCSGLWSVSNIAAASDYSDSAKQHAQSAAIIRWAAKVLGAETVAFAAETGNKSWPIWTDQIASAEPGCYPNGTKQFHIPLIIKPTFGDDNGTS